ncbi:MULTISPECIES: hypothetical protein [unclassified Janibacter]|uniref:hypothetical protein n=1 Tax=Janibacter TaxID=53457 RepID=UPI00162456C5|nr:hypothetical protein [Janibacter sp. YB324]QNF93354.1 hypothetical protein H7A72_11250 [Janibacter sp. YB324]
MPPSHPRPEDLDALVDALSATGEHTAATGELLLDHLVTVGDHATQRALDGMVDDTVDSLREISAGCRELALAMGPRAARSASSSARGGEHARPDVRELR